MPRILSDIVTRLVEDRAPLSVVAYLESRFEIESRLPVLFPDLVLIGLRAGEADAIAATALMLAPAARIVAFSFDGRHAYVHETHAHRVALMDVSPAALVDVILAPRWAALARRV
jgi:DNA-binding NarL/FixJ family response regulator